MSQSTDFMVVTACGLGAVATVIVAVVRQFFRRAEPSPVVPAGLAPDAYVPCHTTVCAHMTVAHDRTAAGLTCRGCGTTKEAL